MEYIFILPVIAIFVAGFVWGTHELLVHVVHPPEIFIWAVPLAIFFMFVVLIFKFLWKEI